MLCFARWKKDENHRHCFRDQTILQFGDSWKLLANFILLNPGSASPKDEIKQNKFLEDSDLPFYINDKDNGYYEFTIDRLMNDLLKLYSANYSGGVLKLYNLFNLKNQYSGDAIAGFKENMHNPNMVTAQEEILFAGAPVIIACGRKASSDDDLKRELEKYIKSALKSSSQIYSLSKVDRKLFAIVKTEPDENGIIESYHPSYTFKYGNATILEQDITRHLTLLL